MLHARRQNGKALRQTTPEMTALFRLVCLAMLVPPPAWSQPPLVEHAYVSIVPKGETDVDSVLEFERGVELVLCQAGVRPRTEAARAQPELKLSASLMRADYVTDQKAGQILRQCELAEAAATLPDGSRTELPDVAISSRSAIPGPNARRGATDTFFLACGANFARGALDALKDKVALRGVACDASSRTSRSPARASPKKR